MTAWSEVRRGWTLVLACGMGFGLGLSGLPFYTYGVFVEPLRHAFGWSLAQAQAGLTMSYLTTMVSIPVVGWLADRFGARPVALTSLALFSLSYMLLGFIDGGRVQFLLLWMLIAGTGTGTLSLTWGRAISGAFDKARGLALGLALLGTGLVGFIAPPLARMIMDAYGWRAAFVALGFAPLVLAMPLVFIFFREAGPRAPARMAERGPSPLTDRRLWIIGLSFLMIAIGITALVPNLIKIATRAGMEVHQAVFVSSLVGLFVIVGRVGCGVLMDRFWAPGVAVGFLLLPAAACALLALPRLGPLPAAVAASLIGLTAGAEFDLLPYLVSRYFGLARFGAVLGVASAFFYLGAAAGAPAMGWIYDQRGDFGPGLVIVGVLFTLSAVGLLLLGPYPETRAPGAIVGSELLS